MSKTKNHHYIASYEKYSRVAKKIGIATLISSVIIVISLGLFAYTENTDSYVGTVSALFAICASAIAVPTLMTYLGLIIRRSIAKKI
ncbi:hypothetical protein [Paenibacillus macquariensis]|uniref:Uncharacterized protein n=1 Tax=Paenibacillus macquariensis TaxID=948756 RepID=A0ABY1K5Z1_9BACL|nr:hypothetical protein [Paenibacillus macquariensis]MEC0090513.1 hypothetical protein [Paenibacillus macquariensis]OAB38514.1 hypothetical protein PMSM_01550 [Paenibacillus macquariensis subsp. macquariensis]SIR30422.1 hypothetical protein SAMN05421578_110134 [Paenibacillus macquariensis]